MRVGTQYLRNRFGHHEDGRINEIRKENEMKYVLGFLRFWYDFIIGDSWQTAAGVAGIFACGAWLAHAQILPGELLAPIVGVGIMSVAILSLFLSTKSDVK